MNGSVPTERRSSTSQWSWYRVRRPFVPVRQQSCRWHKAFWLSGSQVHREIHVDAAVALLVGIGQRTLGDVASYAQVVELGLVGAQTGFDVAQTLTVSQLSKNHAQKLIEIRKSLGGIFGGVALHTTTECVKE